MEQVQMTDHEFAAWLRKHDPNWIYEQKGNACEFYAHGKCIAIAIFDNANCTKKVFINED